MCVCAGFRERSMHAVEKILSPVHLQALSLLQPTVRITHNNSSSFLSLPSHQQAMGNSKEKKTNRTKFRPWKRGGCDLFGHKRQEKRGKFNIGWKLPRGNGLERSFFMLHFCMLSACFPVSDARCKLLASWPRRRGSPDMENFSQEGAPSFCSKNFNLIPSIVSKKAVVASTAAADDDDEYEAQRLDIMEMRDWSDEGSGGTGGTSVVSSDHQIGC